MDTEKKETNGGCKPFHDSELPLPTRLVITVNGNRRKICEKTANAINMSFCMCYQNPLRQF